MEIKKQGKKHRKKIHQISVYQLILLDAVIRVSKRYYPQKPLEECKYEIKKIKMENLINDDLDESDNETKSDNDE